MPAPPANPWTKRSTMSAPIVGASAQATEATTKPAIPISSGSRRPTRSLSGPATSWPAASPSRNVVSVSCTADALVSRVRCTSGHPGRYMSTASGTNAPRHPSSTMRRVETAGCACALVTAGP